MAEPRSSGPGSPDPLERALLDLGDHIAQPAVADLAPAVVAQLEDLDQPRRPWPALERRRAAIAFAVVAAVVAALLVLPAPRRAIADRLGIGAVRIAHTDLPGRPAGSQYTLGRQVSLNEARPLAGRAVVGPAVLGRPTSVFVGEPSPKSVSLVWAPRDGLPEVRDTGVGLLLTEIPGTLDEQLIQKMIGAGTTLEAVVVGGRSGYWISGSPHEVLYLDPSGEPRLDTTHLAANTLLWTVEGVTFRLESGLDRAEAIDLATQLTPL